ncbi:MAG: hypothetical protein ACTSW4_05875 [Candidatus Ranarchaeia archaeon]
MGKKDHEYIEFVKKVTSVIVKGMTKLTKEVVKIQDRLEQLEKKVANLETGASGSYVKPPATNPAPVSYTQPSTPTAPSVVSPAPAQPTYRAPPPAAPINRPAPPAAVANRPPPPSAPVGGTPINPPPPKEEPRPANLQMEMVNELKALFGRK